MLVIADVVGVPAESGLVDVERRLKEGGERGTYTPGDGGRMRIQGLVLIVIHYC
jgi:hypothetical protein